MQSLLLFIICLAPFQDVAAPSNALDIETQLRLLEQLEAGNLDEDIPLARILEFDLSEPQKMLAASQRLQRQAHEAQEEAQALKDRIARLREQLSNHHPQPLQEIPETSPALPDQSLEQAAQERHRRELEQSQQEHVRATAQAALYTAQSRLAHKLGQVLSSFPSTALRGFGMLHDGRSPAAPYRDDLEQTAHGLSLLAKSIGTLEHHARTGKLVGFASRRDVIAEDLAGMSNSFDRQAQALTQSADDIQRLAAQQSNLGKSLHQKIVRALIASNTKTLDESFVAWVMEQRRIRKRLTQYVGDTEFNLSQVHAGTKSLSASANSVHSLQQAEDFITQSRDFLSQVMRTQAALPAEQLRWQLTFSRETVGVLRPLASESARESVSGFSAEMLSDIRIELGEAWNRMLQWSLSIGREIGELPSRWKSTTLRGTAILMLLLLGWACGRRRFNVISPIVRFLVRRPRFRGRTTAIVRWANLAQTLFPTLAVLAAGYSILGVIGFHRPFTQVVEIILLYTALYFLGQATILGLTKPISRGRPALVDASESTVQRLLRTYRRVGAVIVVLLIADELATNWFGVGRLLVVINSLMSMWLLAWAAWAAWLWRVPLAEYCNRFELPPLLTKARNWMSKHRAGAILSPVVALSLFVRGLLGWARRFAAESGLLAYVRAKALRRAAMADGEPKTQDAQLPKDYIDEFPLYPLIGDTDAVILPREQVLGEIVSQVDGWRTSRVDGSVVVVGEKGIGKTTLMGLLETRVNDIDVHEISLDEKCTSEQMLVSALAPALSIEATSLADLESKLKHGPERVVVLDEAHNTFLRVLRGYAGFDALVDLVNSTAERVFWVVVFNAFAWRFMNEIRGRTHYFRKLIELEPWKSEEIQDLIDRRNRRSGYSITFDAELLDRYTGGERDFELVDGAEGYFRLLWETSHGNPRIALTYWLRSLEHVGDNKLKCKLFRVPAISSVPGVTDELLFVLAAMCQHENLSADDLERVLRMKSGKARFAIKFLLEHDLIELKHGSKHRYALAPEMYPETIRHLRNKHLLFEGN